VISWGQAAFIFCDNGAGPPTLRYLYIISNSLSTSARFFFFASVDIDAGRPRGADVAARSTSSK
jgi:hypothetical protein